VRESRPSLHGTKRVAGPTTTSKNVPREGGWREAHHAGIRAFKSCRPGATNPGKPQSAAIAEGNDANARRGRERLGKVVKKSRTARARGDNRGGGKKGTAEVGTPIFIGRGLRPRKKNISFFESRPGLVRRTRGGRGTCSRGEGRKKAQRRVRRKKKRLRLGRVVFTTEEGGRRIQVHRETEREKERNKGHMGEEFL